MKNSFIILALLLNYVCSCAQVSNSKIESVIRNLEDKENSAILNHDIDVLQEIWAPDLTVNTPFNRITFSSKELIDMVNNGTLRFSSFKRIIEQIMIKKDVAITMGSEEVVFVGGSAKGDRPIKRRYTNIWIFQDGKWKLGFRHAHEICPLQ